nr:hypothetical protein [Tanacetum cinerariifolium]
MKESINLINVLNNSSEDFLEDLFSSNQPSGYPTFSSHPELTLSKVKNDIFDPEGGNVLPVQLLDLDSIKDLHPPLHVNPLSGSTTYSSSPSQLPEGLADELALIKFPLKYDDDIQFNVKSDLKEIEFLFHQDIDSILKDSIDQNKKLAISIASLILEDFDPPHEPLFFKEVPRSKMLLPFSLRKKFSNQGFTLLKKFILLDIAEYTIKVPPPLVQKSKPPSQRNFVVHQKDPLHPNIPYPSRMYKQKQQEKDEKMLKALLSNKEKLQELENKPLNENCSAVILKKLLEKLGDPGKFLISRGFSELKCKALADLANRAICTSAGIARDVFVLVRKFIFLADFVIVDYESDPRVPLILGRPFLRTAHALIDVHGEDMILLKNDVFDPEGCNVLPEKLLYLDSTKDLHPSHHVNPLSGSTTSSSPNHLLEEFIDELTLITFPPEYDDDLSFDIVSNLKEIEYLINHNPIKYMDYILKYSIDEDNLVDLNNNLIDIVPEMFINEHAPDYSSPPLYDEYDDDLFAVKSDTEYIYNDPFDSNGKKIKKSKLLIDELDLPCDFLSSFEFDSFLSEDFSKTHVGFCLPVFTSSASFGISFSMGGDYILNYSIDEDNLVDLNNNLIDIVPEMFINEHAPDYSSPPLYDEYDDELFAVKADTEYIYNDPFDSKGKKIKKSKLLIDELDLPCDFLSSSEFDSFLSEDFSKVDALPLTNN